MDTCFCITREAPVCTDRTAPEILWLETFVEKAAINISIQKRNTIKHAEQYWRHFCESKLGNTDIIDKKGRAHIIAEYHQIGAFLSGNVLMCHQFGNHFGTHGKAAQISHKNCIGAI